MFEAVSSSWPHLSVIFSYYDHLRHRARFNLLFLLVAGFRRQLSQRKVAFKD